MSVPESSLSVSAAAAAERCRSTAGAARMSLGIYPVFDPRLPGTKFDALGEVIADNFEALDQIARAAKLRPFTAFADRRPIPEGFDGDPDDLKEAMGEWAEWFDAGEGRTAMQALADHIKANPR